ncbi:MAG: hypothetical protein ACI97B_003178, partial [Verrucomicrobiales bacterium]
MTVKTPRTKESDWKSSIGGTLSYAGISLKLFEPQASGHSVD